MTSYKLALLLHLLGVIAYFSGLTVAAVALAGARRQDDPGRIAAVLGLARLGVLAVAAGMLALLAGGFWLISALDLEFGETWLDASIALFVVSLVLGTLGGQAPKRARRLAGELDARGAGISGELRALLGDRRAALANGAGALASLAILVLMVWKP